MSVCASLHGGQARSQEEKDAFLRGVSNSVVGNPSLRERLRADGGQLSGEMGRSGNTSWQDPKLYGPQCKAKLCQQALNLGMSEQRGPGIGSCQAFCVVLLLFLLAQKPYKRSGKVLLTILRPHLHAPPGGSARQPAGALSVEVGV